MAINQINLILVLRADNSTNWESSTYEFQAGEVGLEFLQDSSNALSGKVKMKACYQTGQTWAEMPYIGGDETKVLQANSLDEITETELNPGDTAIIKTLIADGKYSYTAYVYNGTAWEAMDGNYSAENVYLKDDITLAGNYDKVGNYSKGTTLNAGTSLASILSGLFQQELEPILEGTDKNIDLPTVSISVSGGNGEVGNSYTLPIATLKIDDVGSYPYAPTATGITFAIGDVELKQNDTNKKSNDTVMVQNSTLKLQATDTETLYTDGGKTYTFSATADYTAGNTVPCTNLGNERPNAKIPDGSCSVSSKTATFSGWRYIFAGGTEESTIDSAAIRELTKAKKSNEAVPTTSGGKGIEFSAVKGSTKVIFAYPSSWTTKTPKFEIFTMAWGPTEGFEKSTVNVADARGGSNGLKEYTVYTYTPATPLAADTTRYCVYFA